VIFPNGEFALAWLINDATVMSYPKSQTKTIIKSIKSGNPQQIVNVDNDSEDTFIAFFDLTKLLNTMEPREVELLVTYVVEGIKAAIDRLSKGKEWDSWRMENKAALSHHNLTCTKKLWDVLDKWDNILYDNDYIGEN